MPVHQRAAQRKRLRHAYQRIVYRGIAVRVIFTQAVTDDAGTFAVGFVGVKDSSCMVYRMRRCTGFSPSSTGTVHALK